MANKSVIGVGHDGMNSKVAPLLLKESECELILNYNIDTIGHLTKRNGYDTYGDQPQSGKTILGLFMFNDTSGSEDNAVMVANNAGDTQAVIYEDVSGTWTSRNTAGTAGIKHRFATFLDYVFRVNGTDTVLTSADLTTWGTTNAPATITPSFVAVFQDRVYVARNGTAAASRVYFSGLPSGGSVSWDTTNDTFDVNPDDGDEITALENNGNRLLIFKNRALYRWNFGQIEPDRLIGVGTKSQECVKTNLDLGITFFANEYGAFAYDGGRPKLISRKIQNWFDAVPAANVSNFAAETDEDHYYLYLSDSMTVDGVTYTNVMAVYTISLDAWVIYTLNTPVRVMAKLIISNSEDIYFGGTTGRVYQWNSGTADDSGGASSNTAADIEGRIIFKEHILSLPEKSKVTYVDIIANQRAGARAYYRLDRAVQFDELGEMNGRVHAFETKSSSNVHTCQVQVADNSQTVSIISGYNIEYEPSKQRKNVE